MLSFPFCFLPLSLPRAFSSSSLSLLLFPISPSLSLFFSSLVFLLYLSLLFMSVFSGSLCQGERRMNETPPTITMALINPQTSSSSSSADTKLPSSTQQLSISV